jgi:hypothetical protein
VASLYTLALSSGGRCHQVAVAILQNDRKQEKKKSNINVSTWNLLQIDFSKFKVA